jgi:hypothetical protein
MNQTVKAYYDGRYFVPETPVKIAKNQTVLLSFTEYIAKNETQQKSQPHILTRQEKNERDARELAILNENAEQMNIEAADVFLYQKDIFDEESFPGDI